MDGKRSLLEIAKLFLWLGSISFGGPAVHIAMMEDEFVRRRQWLSREKFIDLLGATHLIPGPNSTELAMHIGYHRAGWSGFLVSGISFILPAAFIVSAFAWAYQRYGLLPQADAFLYGVTPIIVAIVMDAVIKLGRSAIKKSSLAVLGAAVLLAHLLGVNEIFCLLLAGLLSMLVSRARASTTSISLVAAIPLSLTKLFLFFLKVGSVLYGSGYVLIAFLRADLVERWDWLTQSQLIAAITVGQVTPGPVFTTATFVGYLLGGGEGALVSTVGIFLPAFFFVAISVKWIPRLRRSSLFSAMLDGVNVASLALMASVAITMGTTFWRDWISVGILAVGLFVLLRFRLNSVWLLFGGALIGFLKISGN